MNAPRCWALVPAAGSGSRLGGEKPKQYVEIAGKPLLAHTLKSLTKVGPILGIAVGLASDDRWWHESIVASDRILGIYVGGVSRAETILRGLEFLEAHVHTGDWVLVHDAVRPCIRPSDIERLISERGDGSSGALLAFPAPDTMKQSNGHDQVERTISREGLWCAQTPQLFLYRSLRDALERCDLATITDDSSAMEAAGYTPRLVLGRADNLKVTSREDLELATLILQARCQGDGR
jgi:2-C-methyl-D-erythritol 4-phosphate cytidylyltransferase